MARVCSSALFDRIEAPLLFRIVLCVLHRFCLTRLCLRYQRIGDSSAVLRLVLTPSSRRAFSFCLPTPSLLRDNPFYHVDSAGRGEVHSVSSPYVSPDLQRYLSPWLHSTYNQALACGIHNLRSHPGEGIEFHDARNLGKEPV